MKRLRSFVLAVVVAAGAIISMLPAQPVSAATSSSLSIEPRKNYVIKPGNSVNDNLIISNLSDSSSLTLSLRVVDFTYSNDGGTPKLFLSPTAPQTTWSLKPFMKIPDSVTIPAGATKKIPVDVSIPKGHGAGGYYSAIVYSSGDSNGGNVGLSASGVTLVFTTIPGKVKEHLALTHLGAYHAIDASHPHGGYMSFASGQPDMIGYTMKNSGNVTEQPAGTITLKNIFGKSIAINNINPQGSLALIGQTRTFTPCIKLHSQGNSDVAVQGTQSDVCDNPHLWPGYYSVHLDAFYGQNGNQTQEVIGNGWFWYLPTWFLIVCALVLLVLIYVGWRVYRFVQKLRYGAHRPRRR